MARPIENAKSAVFAVKVGKTRLDVEAVELTIGTRSGCDLVIRDPIAAGRHLRIRSMEDGFVVDDLNTSTGTYVNGVPAGRSTPLKAGDEIVIGVTRLTATVGIKGQKPLLTLEGKERSFFFVPGGKAEPEPIARRLAMDPDAWARTEVGLGRFRPVSFWNWWAVLGGLVLVGLLFVPAVEEPLLDPGPLCRSHAQLFGAERPRAVPAKELDLAKEQGCRTCHESFGGTPMAKCRECHGEMMAAQHPFRIDPDPFPDPTKVARAWGKQDCALCHVDHRGADARAVGFVPEALETAKSCDVCHAGTQLAAQDFATTRSPVAVPRRERLAAAFAFGHDDHVSVRDPATDEPMTCAYCHEPEPAAVSDGEARREEIDPDRKDYRPVKFETCVRCHVERKGANGVIADARDAGWKSFWPRKGRPGAPGIPENLFTVNWHGSDEPSSACLKCHEKLHDAELRHVQRADVPPAAYASLRARYRLARRSHMDEFKAHAQGEACGSCHRREELSFAMETDAVFWHSVHLEAGSDIAQPGDTAAKAALSAACLKCHSDQSESGGLLDHATALYQWAPPSCGECHKEGSGEGARPLQVTPLPVTRTSLAATIPRSDFPHRYHLDFRAGGKLQDGCFTCHEFAPVVGEPGSVLVPATKPEARECKTCHAEHAEVGGGTCQKCHPMVEGRYNDYFGTTRPPGRAMPAISWPESNAFNHWSPGHKPLSDAGNCRRCHTSESEDLLKDLAKAETLTTVPIPDESDKTCRDCHLQLKQRFHWR